MSPPGRSSDPDRARDPPPVARAARPGKPGLPLRGRFRHSNVSIWLLAVCIAVALILRATTAEGSQERLLGWLPDGPELDWDVEVMADRQIGSTTRMRRPAMSADMDDLRRRRSGSDSSSSSGNCAGGPSASS